MNSFSRNDDWDEDDDDIDRDDISDVDGEDEELTVPCPYCRKEIFEDTPRCPYCERYVSSEDRPGLAPEGRPAWVIVTAIVCLAMALAWALGGL